MTALELIEEGLINQDWSYIRKARQLLKTGKSPDSELKEEQKLAKEWMDKHQYKPSKKKIVLLEEKPEEQKEAQVRPKKKAAKKAPKATKKTAKKAGRPKKTPLVDADPDNDDVDIEIAPLEGAIIVEELPEDHEPVASRPRPFEPRKGDNRFRDDGSLFSQDAEFDKRVWAGKKPEPRTRPKAKMVKAKCHSCGKTVEVSQALAPRRIGEETAFFKCDRCIGGR